LLRVEQFTPFILSLTDGWEFSFLVVCPERPCSLIILRAVKLLSSLRQQQNADRKATTFK
jgi:hypothetical protein